jgi:hypothetical protein
MDKQLIETSANATSVATRCKQKSEKVETEQFIFSVKQLLGHPVHF